MAVVLLVGGYSTVEKVSIEKIKTNISQGISDRSKILRCANGLLSLNPILGNGIKEQQFLLNECYNNYTIKGKRNFLRTEALNSHNYYYYLMLSSGIFVTLLFIIMLIYCYYISIKKNLILYFCFLILITLSLIIENYLQRMYGVFFFAIFNTIWIRNIWK
ncbi:hypothetical protein [Pontimicrobium sp. MEBiC06410]